MPTHLTARLADTGTRRRRLRSTARRNRLTTRRSRLTAYWRLTTRRFRLTADGNRLGLFLAARVLAARVGARSCLAAGTGTDHVAPRHPRYHLDR